MSFLFKSHNYCKIIDTQNDKNDFYKDILGTH